MIRRNDTAHRLEMTPMIDVIFLLLTFFVYSMAMMIRASVLPVQLTPLASGKPAAASNEDVQSITVDKDGRLFFNREVMSIEQLDARLVEMAKAPTHPRLFLAMEAAGATDRGPLLINLIERLRLAGINDFVIVGQPREGEK